MRTIGREQLEKEFAEHSALFFTPDGILVETATGSPVVPLSKTIQKFGLQVLTIYLDRTTLLVSCPSPDPEAFGHQFHISSPKSFLQGPTPHASQVLRATHWMTWDRMVQCCSQCGGALEKIPDRAEKKCTACHVPFFPNLAPAVMVLVQRGNEVLLARSPHFKPGIYSALAGFIDLGETAEEASHREVQEEVGIEISNLQYFGSQSWPFPGSFMIAFTADYLRGELCIDYAELEDAQWFSLNNLPALPPHSSISRKLIDMQNPK